ncbi:hypothetical protein BT93_A0946 [Corymbia citriodora subsp. variegata]|nr:hypothetical protein BT93_A0946 [Corymbia citriodora subsp. variegata]
MAEHHTYGAHQYPHQWSRLCDRHHRGRVAARLTLAGTVIALTIATPLLVIFSPVIVPAVITVGLLIMGFLASGGFGVAAVTVLSWIYKYVTGKHPPGADQLDQARMKLASKAREMKDRADQFGQQHVTGQS